MARDTSRRPRRLGPEFLKQLRSRRVAVIHPNDADGGVLRLQLQRIGCQVHAYWPPPAELPEGTDIVFCSIQPERQTDSHDWLRGCESAIVIGVIGYENPTVFDALLALNASWVITVPVRSTGVLSALVMTIQRQDEVRALNRRIARLEERLASGKLIGDAKAIIARSRQVSDDDAYRLLREQAMSRRVSVEEIARAIVNADAILSR
ncbi:MAG: ANTAR domain-containing protein [Burkholderiaceae bacterium]